MVMLIHHVYILASPFSMFCLQFQPACTSRAVQHDLFTSMGAFFAPLLWFIEISMCMSRYIHVHIQADIILLCCQSSSKTVQASVVWLSKNGTALMEHFKCKSAKLANNKLFSNSMKVVQRRVISCLRIKLYICHYMSYMYMYMYMYTVDNLIMRSTCMCSCMIGCPHFLPHSMSTMVTPVLS